MLMLHLHNEKRLQLAPDMRAMNVCPVVFMSNVITINITCCNHQLFAQRITSSSSFRRLLAPRCSESFGWCAPLSWSWAPSRSPAATTPPATATKSSRSTQPSCYCSARGNLKIIYLCMFSPVRYRVTLVWLIDSYL